MSDYVVIQDQDQGYGQIAVNQSVINAIVRNVIETDENVHLEEIRGLKTQPTIEIDDSVISISMKVRIQYGKDVESSCLNLKKKLENQLKLMVDYDNPIVEFNVVGFKFD
ncbi:MAG: hypothetical protein GX984_06235 [Erysipelothrix sp.]|nr:hypothetical protein [Erysipelothrix sp.]